MKKSYIRYLILIINFFVINFFYAQAPIKRIPAYMYFNGIHQNDEYQYFLRDYNLDNLCKIIDQLDSIKKQEYINQIVAFVVIESALLKKPLADLTVKDISRLNAIFLYKLDIDPERCFKNYIPGMFRKDFRLKSRSDGYAWDHLNADELKIWAHIVIRSEVRDVKLENLYPELSEEEKIVVNKLFTIYKPVEQIAQEFNLLIQDLSNSSEEYAFSLAARMHFRITEIHPFCDANGRTSRALKNIILMHKGIFPIFNDDKLTYINIMQNCNWNDYAKLVEFINLKATNISQKLGNLNSELRSNIEKFDIFGISIYENFSEYDNWHELIRQLFEKIDPEDPNTINILGLLFEAVKQKLF